MVENTGFVVRILIPFTVPDILIILLVLATTGAIFGYQS